MSIHDPDMDSIVRRALDGQATQDDVVFLMMLLVCGLRSAAGYAEIGSPYGDCLVCLAPSTFGPLKYAAAKIRERNQADKAA